LIYCFLQGQASDIIIQANEIRKVKENLHRLYVHHTGQPLECVGELVKFSLFARAPLR